jgi:DNA-binding beta-propeller fold protein YncE
MLITKKDRSFILLIVSVILIIHSVISISPYIKSPFYHKNHKILTKEKNWFNINEKPTNQNLESKLILLSFIEDEDIAESFTDSKNIKKQFSLNLSLIAIYNGQKEIDNIIDKFHLNFPIIFDKNSNISDFFQSNHDFILLDDQGEIYDKYQKTDLAKLNQDLSNLISNKTNLTQENFKIPYHQITPSYILSAPRSIDNYKSNIVIANSGHNNLIMSSLDGRINKKIGSKIAGLKDGDIKEAQFNFPQSFTISNDIIYVADSGNNAIRKINLKNNEVSTIIGSGKKGSYLKGTINSKKANLWFPTDITLSSDKKNLIIVNYGASQILSYNFKKKTISSLTDPKLNIKPKNINIYQDRIYFIDQNMIKFLNKNNEIEILEINDKKIISNAFKIQKNILFNVDSEKNIIQKINLKSNKIRETKIKHNIASDILNIANDFYLVESNDNRIVKINLNDIEGKIFDILPKLERTEDKIIKYLPNFNFTDEIFLKSDIEINVEMDLKKGWKINNDAPNFINLIEIDGDKNAKLIKIYDWKDIAKNNIKLPKLKKDFIYYIKAIIYYCKDKENSICMVNEYHKKINISHNILNKKIKIDFIYQ